MPVTITLDKPRELRYRPNALVRLQETLGNEPISKTIREITPLDYTRLRAVVWAGLLHEGREAPSLDQVGDLIGAFVDGGGHIVDLYNAWDTAIAGSGLIGPAPKPSEGNVAADAAAPSPSSS